MQCDSKEGQKAPIYLTDDIVSVVVTDVAKLWPKPTTRYGIMEEITPELQHTEPSIVTNI